MAQGRGFMTPDESCLDVESQGAADNADGGAVMPNIRTANKGVDAGAIVAELVEGASVAAPVLALRPGGQPSRRLSNQPYKQHSLS